MTFEVKHHAFLATGNKHRVALHDARQFGRGLGDLALARHRPMHRRPQFLAVRRDQRGAAINAVIVMFRIDHDRFAEAPRLVDDGADNALRCLLYTSRCV